jgi:hypothetical protein
LRGEGEFHALEYYQLICGEHCRSYVQVTIETKSLELISFGGITSPHFEDTDICCNVLNMRPEE